jgi:drug/metabolite transporter (DMT)-like permease
MPSLSKDKMLGLAGLLGASFVSSAVMPSLIRVGVSTIHPFIFNWLRAFFSILIILPFYLQKHRFSDLISRKRWPLIAILGLGLGLNVTLFSFGLQRTTIIASQLIYVVTPIVVSLLAYFLIGEKITKQKAIGIALSLIGIFILMYYSYSPSERQSLGTAYGNFLILIGMFGYSCYMAFSKKFIKHISLLELVAITNFSLTLFLSPLLLYALSNQENLVGMSASSLLASVLIGACTVITISLIQLSVKHLTAATASLGTIIGPEFAALTGILFYDEKLSLVLITSLLLSVSGVLVSTTNGTRGLFDRLLRRS